ncbi:MAG: hypothetical protein ABFD15_06640 [Methanofastidiosum sp.]
MNKKLEFIECDTCRAKAGTPTLCQGCISNRATITKLKELLESSPKSPQEALPPFITFKGTLTHVYENYIRVNSEDMGRIIERVISPNRITALTYRESPSNYSVAISSFCQGNGNILIYEVDEDIYQNLKEILLQIKEEPKEKLVNNALTRMDLDEDP